MSFRGTQRYRPNYAGAAMVQGGAVDGLADLAKAFIEAPIMRRKIELANKRQALEEADRAEARQYRHEEHDATMALNRAKLAGTGKPGTLKATQVNGITMGIMQHARQAGIEDAGQLGKTFNEAKARQEYEHLRKLVPAEIRSQIPDYDGALVGDTEAPAAQAGGLDTGDHAELDHAHMDAGGGADGDGADAEGLTDHDFAGMGSGGAPAESDVHAPIQGPMQPDEQAWSDAATGQINDAAAGRKPLAAARRSLDPADLATFVAGGDRKPLAAARLQSQQGEVDTGRAQDDQRRQDGVTRAARAQAAAKDQAARSEQEDRAIATIVPTLHPRDQAAFQRVLATGDAGRISVARQRLLQLANGDQPDLRVTGLDP